MSVTFYLLAEASCSECGARGMVRVNKDEEWWHECHKGNTKVKVPKLETHVARRQPIELEATNVRRKTR